MANKINYRTEDEVRNSAQKILGFDKKEANVKQGTGQITTFNQLGFKGVNDKPDGWYLPDDKEWKEFVIKDLFTVKRPSARSQINYDEGHVPFIASGNFQ